MLRVTEKNFGAEVTNSAVPVMVMFYAAWCGKCAMMRPVAEELEKKFKGRIRFCETEIEESAALAAEFGVDIVPTFVLFAGGEAEWVMQGVLGEAVLEKRLRELP